MSNLDQGKQLLIKGNIDNDTLTSIQEISVVSVSRVATKFSPFTEIIHLIFNDFSIISFTRDLLISSLLSSAYQDIKSAIELLFREKKEVKELTFIHKISLNNRIFVLNTTLPPEQIDILISRVDIQLKHSEILDAEFIQEIIIKVGSDGQINIQTL